jgi:hypothetical protein
MFPAESSSTPQVNLDGGGTRRVTVMPRSKITARRHERSFPRDIALDQHGTQEPKAERFSRTLWSAAERHKSSALLSSFCNSSRQSALPLRFTNEDLALLL